MLPLQVFVRGSPRLHQQVSDEVSPTLQMQVIAKDLLM